MNAAKAVKLGVGLKVDRPEPEEGQEVEAARKYRADVCNALREVVGNRSFKAAVEECAGRLKAAGGTEKAVDLIIGVISQGAKKMPTAASLAGA